MKVLTVQAATRRQHACDDLRNFSKHSHRNNDACILACQR